MGGSRNKSKKFLKQKQAKQKRRSPQKVKNGKNKNKSQSDGIKNTGNKPGLTRDDLASLSNSDIYFHKVGGHDDASEISDNISLVSELTIAADDLLDETEQQDAYNELDEHFDNLSEKDAIMRMSALNAINHALRRRVFDDYLRARKCDKLTTLALNLRKSLMQGSARERCIALETCGLVVLTLQDNHNEFMRSIRATILKFIQSPKSTHVQIKAIEVWTCMTWVLDDNAKTLKTIELLDDIWMKRLSHKRLKAKFKEKNAQNAQLVNDNDNNNNNNENENVFGSNTGNTYMKDSNGDSSDSFSSDDDNSNVNNNKNSNNNNNSNDNDTEEKKADDAINDIDDTASGSIGIFLNNDDDNNEDNNNNNNGNSNLFTQSQTDLLLANSKKIMPDSTTIAALENWVWLIASINNANAIGSLLDEYYLDLMDLLEHNKNIELRCAAGKALTLLISNDQMSIIEENPNKVKNAIEDYKNGKRGFDFDNVLSVFDEFMQESNIRRKKELKEQKKKFREYSRTLENKWTPTIKIKLRGKIYEQEGWCKWIQYHCLKKILKSGFQPHLLENSSIQFAFGMENVEAPQPLTQLEKKSKLMGHADDAKRHKQKIKRERHQKRAFMKNESAEMSSTVIDKTEK